MTFSVKPLSALEYFSSLVQSDEQFPLLEAAASLAQDEHPEIAIGSILEDLDRLAVRIKARVAKDAPPLHRLRLLNQFFYGELGFCSNLNHYYDPENSFIPITLAVIWLELAQSLGLKASGVSFPGHFLVKLRLPNGQAVMDPVTGLSLSRDDLIERLAPFIRQPQTPTDPEAMDVMLALYLQSASPRDIVGRMLRNLKEIYWTDEDWPRALQVLDRLTILLPEGWEYRKERGLIYADQGNLERAEDDLLSYIAHSQDPRETSVVEKRLKQLREKGQ
jgi:regulator of sirC expression with transglutaminase-like and TPR domain